MYLESPVCLNFFILYLFLVNGSQALYGNPGCLKCISGIDTSPANKNLLIISSILHFQNKRGPNKEI